MINLNLDIVPVRRISATPTALVRHVTVIQRTRAYYISLLVSKIAYLTVRAAQITEVLTTSGLDSGALEI